jgi:hypothetical protein
LLNAELDAENKSLLEALGYIEGDVIDFFITNVGKTLTLNVEDNEYNGKTYPLISYQ